MRQWSPSPITQDPVLGRDAMATVFRIPQLDWHIVVVAPDELLTSAADRLSVAMAWWSAVLLIVAVSSLLGLLHVFVARPIARLTNDLASRDDDRSISPAILDRDDEIGELAKEFYRRNQQLAEAAQKQSCRGFS